MKRNRKQNKKKVLAFRAPQEKPAASPMIFQIGNDRFAIHWKIEELPPTAPLIYLKRKTKKELPGS